MISAIIPTYKNKVMLLNNLRQNLPYLQDVQIIIVNDDPTESLKKDLSFLPNHILVENKNNLGFGQSINQGIRYADGNFVMLLNSDVLLNNQSYQSAVDHFRRLPGLFAVSFAQQEQDGSIVGRNELFWKNGFFCHQRSSHQKRGKNGWAEAGSCLLDKNKFMELGGFDPVYSPFYWEDIDLSFRASLKNYQTIFDPQIKVIHHHESTIGKYFSSEKIREIAFRNQLIFTWKYLNRKSLPEHIFFLIPALTLGGLPFIKGFIQALRLLPSVIKNKMYI